MFNEARVEQLKNALNQLNDFKVIIGENGALTTYRQPIAGKPISAVRMRVLDPNAPITHTPIELEGRTMNSVMIDDDKFSRIEVHPLTKRTSRIDIWNRDEAFPYNEMLKIGSNGVRVVQLIFMLERVMGDLADFARLRTSADGTIEERLIDRLEDVETPHPNLATYPSRMKHTLLRVPTRIVSMTW